MKHFLAASVRCVEAEASLRLILRYGISRHHKINKKEYGAQILLKIWLVFRVQIKCCGSGFIESVSRYLNRKIYLSLVLLMGVQAFNTQKRTSSTSKNEIYYLFSVFVGHFCPPDPDSQSGYGSSPDPIRIRIYNTGSNSERSDLRFEA